MKLKVTLNVAPAPIDIVLTTDAAATVEDAARAIRLADPRQPPARESALPRLTLAVTAPSFAHEVALPPEKPLSEAAIGSGYFVRVAVAESERTDPRGTAAVLRVIRGPDQGMEFPLRFGDSTIGRDPSSTVRLRDPLVSSRHARVFVGNVVELIDLNSANGILVDGGVVPRLVLEAGQTAQLGDTEIAVELLAEGPGGPKEVGGTRPFIRRPRVVPRFPPTALPAPTMASPRDKPRFPWLSLMAPMLMGMSMYALTRNAFSLLFIVMAPLMMIGSYVDGRSQRKKQLATDTARFETEFAACSTALIDHRPREQQIRRQEAPSAADVISDAMRLDELLWSRRPEHWNFLVVRLAVGTATSRVTVDTPAAGGGQMPEHAERVSALTDHYCMVEDVPLAESLPSAGAVGIAGDRAAAADLARSVLVQLTGLHSPAELIVTAIVGPSTSAQFDWLSWLPHTSSPQSPFGDAVHLADSAATGGALLSALEELVKARGAAARAGRSDSRSVAERGADADAEAPPVEAAGLPAVVVLVAADAPVSFGRLVQLTEDAAAAGVFPIWIADRPEQLPAACHTFVDLGHGSARIGYVRRSMIDEGVPERVGHEEALTFARRLSSIVDAGAVTVDASDLPASVAMLALTGTEIADSPATAVDRWRQNGSIHSRDGVSSGGGTGRATLRAIVGQAAGDAMRLDLRTQGPHALVGGTTGAGKSEFLQAWVLGMATEYSPDRVTFLFVDYKGGSAFADCVALPHAVGIVTDLTPYLVRRALTSLRAELHHRELLLSRKKAKDLLELEKRGDPEAPPALVLVIDEFAALVGEVPEFVDGVVDIAQRGRSLGIHLIMATQRPAGVIRDNLRANTNLRVALRMADSHDSSDVVGDTVAATFDPGLPGRAIAKTGPGRLVPFQAAYAGGWTDSAPKRAAVQVAELRFGAEILWRPQTEATTAQEGPTDQARLVAVFRKAADAASIPAPRRPWLDQLPDTIDLLSLEAGSDAELVLGVTDVPEAQARRVAGFSPDIAGHLAVFGTGGSGKSTVLRSVTAAAGRASEPVHVYALDLGGGSLRMLSTFPHVGAVITGDDTERSARLLRTIRDVLDERAVRFPLANAATIADYRAITGEATPRILLLIDGFTAFRDAFDTAAGAALYGVFLRILSEGRQFGVHVVISADRAGSVPTSVLAAVQQRIVLRLSDDSSYLLLGTPNDVLTDASPPGRAVFGTNETQIAVLGGSSNVLDQARATEDLASQISLAKPHRPEPVEALPLEYAEGELPDAVDGKPVLGLSDDDLAPIGFEPAGAFVIAGAPGSGRTTALLGIARSLARFDPEVALYYLGNRRSPVPHSLDWLDTATTPDDVAALARRISAELAMDDRPARRVAVIVESIADFLSGPADMALVELIKTIKRSDHVIVAESESSTWASSWPLLAEMKTARRGIVLQPETLEGDTILRTTFPRVARASFPTGRGLAALGRGAVRVQLPKAEFTLARPVPGP
ncbi:FtsK/SpoIIIE domain-containing protein [Amnibacterium sp.]|uniref:FtsK/SpoIIIE domain-containing protein n=1 Tax=Amnibacterium sp. TaxID=1872496 RepID=UPI00261D8A79|nr:FtsK/SpoIIIE domain-containing protein [Amnibacterium sp.]MCU1474144.1 hypothetical protein [Amnibacterium sp.]